VVFDKLRQAGNFMGRLRQVLMLTGSSIVKRHVTIWGPGQLANLARWPVVGAKTTQRLAASRVVGDIHDMK
jgi:hypothetical protein